MTIVRAFAEHVTNTCLQEFPATYFMCGVTEKCAEWLTERSEKRQTSKAGDVLWYVFGLWMVGLCSKARLKLFDDIRDGDNKSQGWELLEDSWRFRTMRCWLR